MTILLISNSVIAIFLLLLLVISLSNLLVLRSLKDYLPIKEHPMVSILVPARDEEEDIEDCVQSLLAQDYPDFEVIVLDDNSSDNTWQILERIASGDTRLKMDRSIPLQQGWLGKHWVCHQLAQKASGKFLLFTDADTIHQPFTLQRAVAAMEKENADFITVLPQQIMLSFLENLIMPFCYWSIMSCLPLWLSYRTQHPLLAAATGQFMLFRKSAYEKIGGFASVHNLIVDDVELCRKIRLQGLCWRILDGHEDYMVRQYTTVKSLIEGHTKNLFAEFQNKLAVYILTWLWLLLAFWLPVVSLIFAASTDTTAMIVVPIAITCILISLTIWLIAYRRFGFPLYMAFLYPVSAMMMAALAFDAMRLHLLKKATWKGRIVSPNA